MQVILNMLMIKILKCATYLAY